MSWYWWTLIYAGIGTGLSTAVAYHYGRDHTKQNHYGEISTCTDKDCSERVAVYVLAGLIWPIAIIGGTVMWWFDLFERGGGNSALPPLHEYPVPAKNETDMVELPPGKSAVRIVPPKVADVVFLEDADAINQAMKPQRTLETNLDVAFVENKKPPVCAKCGGLGEVSPSWGPTRYSVLVKCPDCLGRDNIIGYGHGDPGHHHQAVEQPKEQTLPVRDPASPPPNQA